MDMLGTHRTSAPVTGAAGLRLHAPPNTASDEAGARPDVERFRRGPDALSAAFEVQRRRGSEAPLNQLPPGAFRGLLAGALRARIARRWPSTSRAGCLHRSRRSSAISQKPA